MLQWRSRAAARPRPKSPLPPTQRQDTAGPLFGRATPAFAARWLVPRLAALIAAHPQIDWPGYAAMRHILAHQCFRRDPALIWIAIADELPALHNVVSRELAQKV